ncbi:hypothetical protein H5410_015356 [Solanum commersonii]|uniref:Uncharacterized protein n=1 Tax=Solanum commersonii TaxID=4109 RepID=A0A9J5ZU59_SOLCO|nr:hypothetical protein H5410_015356 [Solanum commersonii]
MSIYSFEKFVLQQIILRCFIAVLLYPSSSLCFGSLGDIVLFRRSARRHAHTRTKGEDKIFWRFTESHIFILSAAFVSFLLTNSSSVIQKGVSNSATQDSITYAKIKCALKDSSCDSPILKNLELTILASNASSSSTIVFKCHHTKNYSIFTQWFTV